MFFFFRFASQITLGGKHRIVLLLGTMTVPSFGSTSGHRHCFKHSIVKSISGAFGVLPLATFPPYLTP